MIDMFRDLWDAMTPEQQKGISWIAHDRIAYRTLGDTAEEDMMTLLIAVLDVFAKKNSTNYGEYRDQVVAVMQGATKGLLDGGMEYYLREGKME